MKYQGNYELMVNGPQSLDGFGSFLKDVVTAPVKAVKEVGKVAVKGVKVVAKAAVAYSCSGFVRTVGATVGGAVSGSGAQGRDTIYATTGAVCSKLKPPPKVTGVAEVDQALYTVKNDFKTKPQKYILPAAAIGGGILLLVYLKRKKKQ